MLLLAVLWLFIGWCFQGWLLAEADDTSDDLSMAAVLAFARLALLIFWPLAWVCILVPKIIKFINNLNSYPLGFHFSPGYYLFYWLKANKEEKK